MHHFCVMPDLWIDRSTTFANPLMQKHFSWSMSSVCCRKNKWTSLWRFGYTVGRLAANKWRKKFAAMEPPIPTVGLPPSWTTEFGKLLQDWHLPCLVCWIGKRFFCGSSLVFMLRTVMKEGQQKRIHDISQSRIIPFSTLSSRWRLSFWQVFLGPVRLWRTPILSTGESGAKGWTQATWQNS